MESDNQHENSILDVSFDKLSSQLLVKKDQPSNTLKSKYLSGEVPTFATVLSAILIDSYGFEYFTWEPQTLNVAVKEDFNAEMPVSVRDKIWAFVTALTTDRFYTDVLVFNHICNALSDSMVPMQVFDPATVPEIAWSVTEVTLSDTDDKGNSENFSPEVTKFISIMLAENGLKPFAPLNFAEQLSKDFTIDDSDLEALVQTEYTERDIRISDIQDDIVDRVNLMKIQLSELFPDSLKELF